MSRRRQTPSQRRARVIAIAVAAVVARLKLTEKQTACVVTWAVAEKCRAMTIVLHREEGAEK